ncbi:hypothetical protein CB1_000978007 [Camelus ferus]|nr:hypothetical protein CB1_000978007 [Camelus ferus]
MRHSLSGKFLLYPVRNCHCHYATLGLRLKENKKQRSRPRKPRRTRNEDNEQDGDLEGPVIDESVLSMKELLGLQQAEERLKRDCIDRLKREKQEEELLTTLPPPTPSQINAIGIAIDKVVQEFGLHSENLEQRLEIKRIMENAFQYKLPDCSLRLYGSSYSRLGFKTSDVNIDIQFPAIIEGFSLNKLGNFNLKEIQKDSVVWEYTDDATGDTDTAKEEAPKEMPVKRGQVSLIFDFKNRPSVPVGQLWVELLRFYALEFNLADLVISIRVKEAVSRESKDWPKKRIAIEVLSWIGVDV